MPRFPSTRSTSFEHSRHILFQPVPAISFDISRHIIFPPLCSSRQIFACIRPTINDDHRSPPTVHRHRPPPSMSMANGNATLLYGYGDNCRPPWNGTVAPSQWLRNALHCSPSRQHSPAMPSSLIRCSTSAWIDRRRL